MGFVRIFLGSNGGDYAFNAYSLEDVEYAMNLISQSYEIN